VSYSHLEKNSTLDTLPLFVEQLRQKDNKTLESPSDG